MITISNYLDTLNKRYQTGISREHTYRGDLQVLIMSMLPDILVTNEPCGRVYINESQYFDRVPQQAWEFYIGGYQPAQKWLKDRKGRELGFEDI